MPNKLFLRLALPTPLRRLFDYLPPQDVDPKALIPGIRVRVPFGSRILIGILIEVVQETAVPRNKLKVALEFLDEQSILPLEIYQLCQWAADYYHYPLGEVLSHALPVALRKGGLPEEEQGRVGKGAKRRAHQIPTQAPVIENIPQPALALNPAQQQALDTICTAKATFSVFLLDGVTGSGKTEVYLQSIDEILKDGKQVLVLVPEISLTPQTVERFKSRFPVPIAALHSSLSEKARLQAWHDASRGEIAIVIGTRSSIFTPFANLGLIIVDEEHDTSFKQQDRFRYHARDLAIMRAQTNKIPVVLGSATPSLESLLNVERKRYEYLCLPQRAGEANLPQLQILDLRRNALEEGISAALLKSMREHLAQNNQVMLFLNRRGFAPVLYCTHCNWTVGCKRCDTRMVYHRSPERLQCHHCDSRRELPKRCEQCNETDLQPIGLGTQRLEQTLTKHFPDVPIIRVDRDTTRRKGAMQDLLTQIHAQQKAILLGTQMLAKGHHFPHVTLVGIIDADSGLFSADFRATEQMGQLILQVAGRAGRAEKPGTVIIQTRHPEHPLLQILIQQGYQSFAKYLLDEREQALLPPYAYVAMLRAEAYAEQTVNEFLHRIKTACEELKSSVSVFGPIPALIAKRKGVHCQHLLIKADRRATLQNFLKTILPTLEKKLPAKSPVKWVLDVDPVEVI